MKPTAGTPTGHFRNQQEADVSKEINDCMDEEITATMCVMNLSMMLDEPFPKLQQEKDYLALVQKIAEESYDGDNDLIKLDVIRGILQNPND